jgi:hypothetical protein
MGNRALGGGYITTLLKSDEIFERDNPLEQRKTPGKPGQFSEEFNAGHSAGRASAVRPDRLLLLLARLLLAAAALLLTGLALTALLLAGILLVRIVHKCS